MKSKYSVVAIISSLLIVLSITISVINYMVSLENTQAQLKNQSLPLSLDNIYTEIQKNIIEPYLVSSMMANDTFVKDWIQTKEEEQEKIEEYLNTIKNKFGMFSTFLISEKSKHYYTHEGFVETIQKDNPTNKWYFDFKNHQGVHEINLDFNEHLSNSMIMFINYKIFDNSFRLLGATGVALKISYIDEMLKMFRLKHNFKVYFLNKAGKVVLSERSATKFKHIKEVEELLKLKDIILSKEPAKVEYSKDDNRYLLQTKFIPELNSYLIVEAKLDDFVKGVRNAFYINLFISLIITLIIAIIIFIVIRSYNSKLEYLASFDTLTKVLNRRSVMEKLEYFLLLHKRNKQPLSVAFIDIDNFKLINDTRGHETGDLVLKRIAKVLQRDLRKTDILARLGGEEFVILLIDSSLDDSLKIAEKLRVSLEEDFKLKDLTNMNVTASIGLTAQKEDDTTNSIIARADEAMYKAKQSGKNQIIRM